MTCTWCGDEVTSLVGDHCQTCEDARWCAECGDRERIEGGDICQRCADECRACRGTGLGRLGPSDSRCSYCGGSGSTRHLRIAREDVA